MEMPLESSGRGSDPQDAQAFSAEVMPCLILARQEIQFMLDRGYPIGPVIDLVGGHRQLTVRQRMALQRSTASREQIARRQALMLPWTAARDGRLMVDGFNLIITLEVALSGSVLIRCGDGALRDLAGLRGTYRIIPETEAALQLIGQALQNLAAPEVYFLLDAPVSNSGRLRSLILSVAQNWNMPVDVQLAADVDRRLSGKERIVSSDSILLDQCRSWFSLAAKIVADFIPEAWIVDLA
jgi:hypothetical protein